MNALVVLVFGLLIFANIDHFMGFAAEDRSELGERQGVAGDYIEKESPLDTGGDVSEKEDIEAIDVKEQKQVKRNDDGINGVVTLEVENSPTVVGEHEPEVEKEVKKEKVYVLQVEYGMSSRDVSRIMENLGLIENSEDFSSYLMKYGYAKRIQIGMYELMDDMSFEEIAKSITTK